MAEIYQLPENGNGNGSVGLPFSIPVNLGGYGGFGGGFGNGMNGVFDIFALALVASMFGGWGNGGFGGGFGNNNAAAGYIANQLNNYSGRELLMNAITSQGEAGRAAVQNLATMIGQDFNLVNNAVSTVQNALSNLALQQAVSVPQIINSIQSGNSALSQQFCQCCCQTQQQIMAQGYENQIRTIEQTSTLSNQANVNTAQVRADIAAQTTMINEKFCDLEKRELQDKITNLTANNALLRSQIDNANQTAAITSYVNGLVSPIAKEVNDIKCSMPQTVPVQWPQLTAVNTTPYVSGGFYGQPWGGFYGNGFGGNNIVF
ncbi:MAG: hypothetical protein II630_05490 [Bacteroidales bacterium]|nr:hypothetical protein [Bacteroidales bacterium]